MKTVTIDISDQDYADMVEHFEKGQLGRPLVSVLAVVSESPSNQYTHHAKARTK
jgi:hypothetical protein